MTDVVSVAEAKRRFSELIERVGRGERVVVTRRGKPVLALVPPDAAAEEPEAAPGGLLGLVGAFADWEDFEDVVEEIYAARRKARDRPSLGVG